jgi:hypothetical protein
MTAPSAVLPQASPSVNTACGVNEKKSKKGVGSNGPGQRTAVEMEGGCPSMRSKVNWITLWPCVPRASTVSVCARKLHRFKNHLYQILGYRVQASR